MNKNESLNNLSQYKYIYKIYFINKIVHTERFPIEYISKNACYYSNGSGYLTKVDCCKLNTEKDISNICTEIILNNYYLLMPWKNFYIISKNKIDEKVIEVTKTSKKDLIIKQIEILKNELNKLGE